MTMGINVDTRLAVSSFAKAFHENPPLVISLFENGRAEFSNRLVNDVEHWEVVTPLEFTSSVGKFVLKINFTHHRRNDRYGFVSLEIVHGIATISLDDVERIPADVYAAAGLELTKILLALARRQHPVNRLTVSPIETAVLDQEPFVEMVKSWRTDFRGLHELGFVRRLHEEFRKTKLTPEEERGYKMAAEQILDAIHLNGYVIINKDHERVTPKTHSLACGLWVDYKDKP